MTDKEITERVRTLKRIRREVQRKYRGRRPAPDDMIGSELAEEYNLLWALVGTTFMTARMFDRWKRVRQEYSLRLSI